ncbi:MAG: hypothetical protein ACR2OW_04700, partial [Methyloligellaceae bacterium]
MPDPRKIRLTTLQRFVLGAAIFVAVPTWEQNAQAQTDEFVLQVSATSGAKLRTLVSGDPQQAKANILLLAGGNGVLKISGKGQIKSKKNNFLVRSRSLFAKHGYLTALVDAPKDRHTKTGISGGFRISGEHAQDLQKVVDRVQSLSNPPMVIVGTSRGTVSAANIALRTSSPQVKGLILTGSLVAADKSG